MDLSWLQSLGVETGLVTLLIDPVFFGSCTNSVLPGEGINIIIPRRLLAYLMMLAYLMIQPVGISMQEFQ